MSDLTLGVMWSTDSRRWPGVQRWWLEAAVDWPLRVVRWRFRARHLAVQFAARRGIRLEETP